MSFTFRFFAITLLCVASLWSMTAFAQPSVTIDMPHANRDGEGVSVVMEVIVDGEPVAQRGLLPGQNSDNDRDGVLDIDDACPASMGTVNTCGCEIEPENCCRDSDHDGVVDCRDRCPGTHVALEVGPDGCAALVSTHKTIALNLKFDFDSAKLRPGSAMLLNDVIAALRGEPDLRILFDGHADERGSEAYNYLLSVRRAQSVADYVIADPEIGPERVLVRGHGESHSEVAAKTLEAWQVNRRVTTTFFKGAEPPP